MGWLEDVRKTVMFAELGAALPTSDVRRLIAIADAAQKLVEALPGCDTCDGGERLHLCFGSDGESQYVCDVCAHHLRDAGYKPMELASAEPLRALLAALEGE